MREIRDDGQTDDAESEILRAIESTIRMMYIIKIIIRIYICNLKINIAFIKMYRYVRYKTRKYINLESKMNYRRPLELRGVAKKWRTGATPIKASARRP